MNQRFMNTTPIDFESVVQAALKKQVETLEAKRSRALKEQASQFFKAFRSNLRICQLAKTPIAPNLNQP